jgi:hypothetical protein
MASLAGELAGALALAVLDVGANVIATGEDGTMLVARDGRHVHLTIEIRPVET